MGLDNSEFWRKILRLSWLGHQSVFRVPPPALCFKAPPKNGHLLSLFTLYVFLAFACGFSLLISCDILGSMFGLALARAAVKLRWTRRLNQGFYPLQMNRGSTRSGVRLFRSVDHHFSCPKELARLGNKPNNVGAR